MELRRGFLHPYWCLQQFFDLSYVLTSLLGKPNLSLTLQKCSHQVLDTDITPHPLSLGQMRSLFARSRSQNASSFTPRLLREHPPLFSHAPFARASLTARLPNCSEPLAFPLPTANNAYLCNICAVTVVLWQKGNPQAIQPLHLPAWTEFPYSCLLTGVKQVLGWETSWEIQLLQAQTNERGAEMGSRSYLTTTEGIWQRTVLTLYFNSSRPKMGESQASQRRWETGYPPPSNLDF